MRSGFDAVGRANGIRCSCSTGRTARRSLLLALWCRVRRHSLVSLDVPVVLDEVSEGITSDRGGESSGVALTISIALSRTWARSSDIMRAVPRPVYRRFFSNPSTSHGQYRSFNNTALSRPSTRFRCPRKPTSGYSDRSQGLTGRVSPSSETYD